MLGNTPNRYIDLAMEKVGRAAAAAGLDFSPVKIASAKVLGLGLDEVRRAHPDAVLVAAAPAFFPYRNTIVAFMAENRPAGDIRLSGVSRGRRPDQLFHRFQRTISAGGGLRRQNPEGRRARRTPDTAGYSLQAGDQPRSSVWVRSGSSPMVSASVSKGASISNL